MTGAQAPRSKGRRACVMSLWGAGEQWACWMEGLPPGGSQSQGHAGWALAMVSRENREKKSWCRGTMTPGEVHISAVNNGTPSQGSAPFLGPKSTKTSASGHGLDRGQGARCGACRSVGKCHISGPKY